MRNGICISLYLVVDCSPCCCLTRKGLRPTRHNSPETNNEWSQGGALYSPTDLHHCEYNSRNPTRDLLIETCASSFLYKNIFIGNLFFSVFIIPNASLSFNMASLNKKVGKKYCNSVIFYGWLYWHIASSKKKLAICRTRHIW